MFSPKLTTPMCSFYYMVTYDLSHKLKSSAFMKSHSITLSGINIKILYFYVKIGFLMKQQ